MSEVPKSNDFSPIQGGYKVVNQEIIYRGGIPVIRTTFEVDPHAELISEDTIRELTTSEDEEANAFFKLLFERLREQSFTTGE